MNDQLIDYYVNLLIIQYHDKPKATSTIRAFVVVLMIYDIMIKVRDGYNVDTAVGKQQDILGKYAGVSRIITGVDFTRSYFGYARYGDAAPFTFKGYKLYGGIAPDVQFLKYGAINNSIYSLNDVEFRKIIKYRIARNYGSPSVKSVDDFMLEFFGSEATFEDNLDMTMTYNFPVDLERWASIVLSEDLLPRPAGVAVLINFS